MMRKRICVFGNSHIIAVKDGWSLDAKRTAGLEPTFFSAAGNHLEDMRVENGRLIPRTLRTSHMVETTSGGLTYVDVASYDCFMFVGMGLRFAPVLELYARHRLSTHAESHCLISLPVLKATVADIVRSSASYKTLVRLRAITNKPVVITPEPLVSEDILDSGDGDLWKTPHRDFLHDIYVDAVAAIHRLHNGLVFTQPPDTISERVFTRREYSEGARRMWKGKTFAPGTDFRHMNAEYGARVIATGLKLLSRRNWPEIFRFRGWFMAVSLNWLVARNFAFVTCADVAGI